MANIFDTIASRTETGEVHCWVLPNVRGEGRERHIATRENDRLDKFSNKHDQPGYGAFFCVSTIEPGHARKKESARQLPFLFCDIDFKDIDLPTEQIERILHDLELPPSRIHHTSGGLHCFWLLDTPVKLPERMEE